MSIIFEETCVGGERNKRFVTTLVSSSKRASAGDACDRALEPNPPFHQEEKCPA